MRRAALAVVALRAAAQPFAPELSHRYLPRTLNASAARPAADAAARLDALVAASGGLGCRSPLAGHRRSGFGSYLRILCHEAELSLLRGRGDAAALQRRSRGATAAPALLRRWRCQLSKGCERAYEEGTFRTPVSDIEDQP